MEIKEEVFCFDNTNKCNKYNSCTNTNNSCNCNCNCNDYNCLNIIGAIILALFIGTIGLILGAVYATNILDSIASVIVLAIILGILLLSILIFNRCIKVICNYKNRLNIF